MLVNSCLKGKERWDGIALWLSMKNRTIRKTICVENDWDFPVMLLHQWQTKYF